MNESLVSLLANSISFEYHDGICRQFKGDFIKNTWFQLPVYVIGRVTNGYLECSYKNGESIRANAGDVYIMAANRQHRYKLINQGHMQIINAHVNYFLFNCIDLLSLLNYYPVIELSKSVQIADICSQLINIKKQSPVYLDNVVKRQQLAFKLLMLITKDEHEQLAIESIRNVVKVQPVLEFILKNYNKSLTRAQLARQLHLSEPRFHDVFKDATGLAPLTYVKQLRLNKAQQLLLQGHLSIVEVCEAVGYHDQFHFSRLFKAEFGISPTQYRNVGKSRMLS